MSADRRRQFYALLALMLAGAAAELATIGTVIPFIAVLADPGRLDNLVWVERAFEELGVGGRTERLIAATAIFAAAVIAASAIRIWVARQTQEFTYRLGHDISVEIQRRILLQPYGYHIHTNTSTALAAVHKVEVLIFQLLLPITQAITSGFIAAVILAALIYIDPVVAVIAAAGFSLAYVLVSAFTRRRLAANSAAVGNALDERMKIVQESLGGIRDVIIDDSHATYVDAFEHVSAKLSDARANTAFMATAPRFVIEGVGMVLVAALALALSQREGGLAAALPVLGAFALGGQRLLPLLQQIYAGWSTAAGHSSILLQVLGLLSLPVRRDHGASAQVAPLILRRGISFDRTSFTYPTRRRPAVDGVTLHIPRGTTIALVGRTGSGKSTFADLLMGLLEPTEGRICIDGVELTDDNVRRWQRSIAHVPQSIFLADTTIARNIALSRSDMEVDMPRVVEAARSAQLHDFVVSLAEGYETMIGERGIRLSGGQRQRLGIARALYKQAPVLVLDEATSALDSETEAAVIAALDRPSEEQRTIIIISHRRSAIERCDLVARLDSGRLVELAAPSPIGSAEPSARAAPKHGRHRNG